MAKVSKLLLIFLFILTISLFTIHVQATDVNMNLTQDQSSQEDSNVVLNSMENNTTPEQNSTNDPGAYVSSSTFPEANLGLSNILSITLVVIGILLILLGIAILI